MRSTNLFSVLPLTRLAGRVAHRTPPVGRMGCFHPMPADYKQSRRRFSLDTPACSSSLAPLSLSFFLWLVRSLPLTPSLWLAATAAAALVQLRCANCSGGLFRRLSRERRLACLLLQWSLKHRHGRAELVCLSWQAVDGRMVEVNISWCGLPPWRQNDRAFVGQGNVLRADGRHMKTSDICM